VKNQGQLVKNQGHVVKNQGQLVKHQGQLLKIKVMEWKIKVDFDKSKSASEKSRSTSSKSSLTTTESLKFFVNSCLALCRFYRRLGRLICVITCLVWLWKKCYTGWSFYISVGEANSPTWSSRTVSSGTVSTVDTSGLYNNYSPRQFSFLSFGKTPFLLRLILYDYHHHFPRHVIYSTKTKPYMFTKTPHS